MLMQNIKRVVVCDTRTEHVPLILAHPLMVGSLKLKYWNECSPRVWMEMMIGTVRFVMTGYTPSDYLHGKQSVVFL